MDAWRPDRLNAGLNAMIIFALTDSRLLATLVVVLIMPSAWLWMSRKTAYQSLLGWINWFLPMSWLVNAPGLLIFLVNILFAALGYVHPLFQALRIRSILISPAVASPSMAD